MTCGNGIGGLGFETYSIRRLRTGPPMPGRCSVNSLVGIDFGFGKIDTVRAESGSVRSRV